MAFWESVNTGLKKAVDEGWTAVRDSARIGKSRYKLHSLHKQAEALFAEIGGIVYDMADSKGDNPLSRPEVRDLIDDIKRVEALSSEIEHEIEMTREKEKPETYGGAEEGAWPAAVSKEVYEDENDDESMENVTEDTSATEEVSVSDRMPDEEGIDDDSLGATGDRQADESGDEAEEGLEPVKDSESGSS